MVRFSVLFLFVFSVKLLVSQRSEILFKSKVSHNYAIGSHYYVEKGIDTSKLMFMGLVGITSSNQDVFISKAHSLLVSKTKELNGNSYQLRSCNYTDTVLNMVFEIYFSPDHQIKLIKDKRIKDRFIYFNNIKDTLSRCVYINDQQYSFSRSKHLEVYNVSNREVCFQLDTAVHEKKCKTMKSGEDAFFYSIKIRENTNIYILPIGGGIPGIILAGAATTAVILANKYINPNQEKFTNISYSLGRLLMDLYPVDKQIFLN